MIGGLLDWLWTLTIGVPRGVAGIDSTDRSPSVTRPPPADGQQPPGWWQPPSRFDHGPELELETAHERRYRHARQRAQVAKLERQLGRPA